MKKPICALIMALVLCVPTNLYAAEKGIGKGISLEEKRINGGNGYKNAYVVKMDMKNPKNKLVFSKGGNTAMGKDSLRNQMTYIESKGDKVVAAINGDFFHKGTGIGLGPHVENGAIVMGYASLSDQQKCPAIYADEKDNYSIGTLKTNGKIKIVNNNIGNSETTQRDTNIDFFSINRYEYYNATKFEPSEEVVVLTPNYSTNTTIKPMAYAPDDLFVVVKLDSSKSAKFREGKIRVGQEYVGKVTSIVKGKSVTIPSDGFVIACGSKKAQLVQKNVSIGKEIRLKVDFDKPNVHKVISGHSYLVKDGQPSTKEYFLKSYETKVVNESSIRTGVGVDKNGQLLAVVLKNGATLTEFANVMKNAGAVTAVNLDGGGSTQIRVKNGVSTENGRLISNGIMFVNNGRGEANLKILELEKGFNIYKGSKYNLQVQGYDMNYDRAKINKNELQWKVNNSIVTIDKNGIVKAGNRQGRAEITVNKGKLKATTYVNVVDQLKDIEVNINKQIYRDKNSNKITLKKNDKINIDINGINNNNEKVFIDKELIKWGIDSSIGKVNKIGQLQTLDKDGTGKLFISLGKKKIEFEVVVVNKEQSNENNHKENQLVNENENETETEKEDKVINFKDPNLEKAIRKAMDKPKGDIYESEAKNVTDLRISNSNISNLEGIEHFTNLIVLHLHYNNISNITPLQGLTKIKVLSLYDNQIEDIMPLKNMTKMESLNINKNQITSLNALFKMTNIKEIWANENKINNIKSLENIKDITYLGLYMNKIKDITPLSNLTKLTHLSLEYNEITNIEPLRKLVNLNNLGLKRNKIKDYSPTKGYYKNLKSKDFSI